MFLHVFQITYNVMIYTLVRLGVQLFTILSVFVLVPHIRSPPARHRTRSFRATRQDPTDRSYALTQLDDCSTLSVRWSNTICVSARPLTRQMAQIPGGGGGGYRYRQRRNGTGERQEEKSSTVLKQMSTQRSYPSFVHPQSSKLTTPYCILY